MLAGLALVPLAMIVVFWIVKMRKKPVKEWMDEKQLSDTALGGLFGLIAGVIFYADRFRAGFLQDFRTTGVVLDTPHFLHSANSLFDRGYDKEQAAGCLSKGQQK